ncbi:MAG: hypothetical protein QOJ88_328 [Pyrinomonadaceae bacterium]|jgi:glycosyltransferase involved in cell wall biosynthesis|nr:hypothetical protein [Pyrinomonadaceae bacterium]
MSNKFSIAMCTYNGARHLGKQLESIAAQSRPPEELVICDDASTDSTSKIIAEFARAVSFPVHCHTNERNLGSTKNFERALGFCRGDFIALCDQDDIWLPHKLAELEAKFDRAPNVGLIFTDAELVNDDSASVGCTLWEKLPLAAAERRRLQSNRALDELFQGASVTGATMAFRARFKDLVLPIPDDLSIIHDAWIALLISAVAGILPLATPLIKYRQHAGQQVGALKRKGTYAANGFAPGSFRAALRRENPYPEMLALARSVRQRLIDRQQAFAGAEALGRIEERLAHLEMRANLPGRRLSRAPLILQELLTLRYHAYSRGVHSAVKDLLT